MSLTELKCSNCAAPLEGAPDARGVFRCTYCGRSHRGVQPAAAPTTHRHAPGDAVAVKWGSSWWPATVKRVVGDDSWDIHYDGWGSHWDETVGPDRIRDRASAPRMVSRTRSLLVTLFLVVFLAGGCFLAISSSTNWFAPGAPATSTTVFAVGQQVHVSWNGGWYDATIVAVESDGRVRVHYADYGDEWDETVMWDRVRLPAP